MAKIKELGIVKEVHTSGIVETDKGVRSMCKAKKGDRLIQDLATKVISIAPKKTTETKTQKTARLEAEKLEAEKIEADTNGTDDETPADTDEASGDE